jgi:Lipid A core - O-antigen ligase and related enzymes
MRKHKQEIVTEEQVRSPIICFMAFIALMLFQTSYMKLGMLSALTTMAATITVSFLYGHTSFRKFKVSRESLILFFFLILSLVTSFINENIPSYIHRLIGQIVLFFVLSAIPSANEKEQRCIWWCFIVALLFYSFVMLSTMGQAGYYAHMRIKMFETTFDPNFVGLPYVAGSVLLLNAVLTSKRKILFLLFDLIFWVTIVFTASRGTMLSAVFGNACLFLLFVFKNNIAPYKKIALLFLIVFICYFLLEFISLNMGDHWARATTLESGSDNGRLALWLNAIDAFENHPLLGVGLEGMYESYGLATHNTYLQLLSETGILGFILFFVFIAFLFKKALCYSAFMMCPLCGILMHIAFLDALDNRCLWVIFCWIALLPKSEGKNTQK